ncbi:MAG: hypothetical protein WBV78_11890 [Roseobacter sp.]
MPDQSPQKQVGPELPPQEPPARSGVAGAIMVAVLLGAVIGGAAAWFFLPDLMAAAALGGAMMFGAARVFLFVSPARRGLAPIESNNGSHQ